MNSSFSRSYSSSEIINESALAKNLIGLEFGSLFASVVASCSILASSLSDDSYTPPPPKISSSNPPSDEESESSSSF